MATFNPQKLEAQDVLYTIGKMNYHTEFEFLDVTDKVITYAFEWSGKHMAENHEVITDIEEYFESISPGNAFYEQKEMQLGRMTEAELKKAELEEEKARQ